MKSRLLVLGLAAVASLSPAVWSHEPDSGDSPIPPDSLTQVTWAPNAARSDQRLGLEVPPAFSDDVDRGLGAISLAAIAWNGDRATAPDLRGIRRVLTLDRILQTEASQSLRQARPSRGAVVMLSVSDGEILALAEYPPAASRAQSVLWTANTPSASLFKLVTTAALVERAKLQPEHRVCSEGGEHRLTAEQLEAPKQGRIVCSPFSEILAHSRNAAYARLVHSHLAPEDLENFADRFGFNAPLPVDVSAELGRFQPATEPLAFARTATGFIGSSLSALGAAYLGFVIARGGVVAPLHLIDREPGSPQDDDAADAREARATNRWHQKSPLRIIEATTASRLRDMMERVVSQGTAASAFHDEVGRPVLPNLRIAGKTGTLGRDQHTASWFVGFAPSRNPKLVVAILLDNGPIWQTTAKRVASQLMQRYFDRPEAKRPR